MMKRLALAVAFAIALQSGAHAQTGSAKTQAQLSVEVNQFFPDQSPGAGLITPFGTRQTLLDIIASSQLGLPSGTTCSGLAQYQLFANTTGAPTATALDIWDGTQCVQWASLNQTAHTLTLTGAIGSALSPAIGTSQTPSGSQSGSFAANSISVQSTAALTGAAAFLNGLQAACSIQSTAAQGGINCIYGTAGINSPSNASNANHNYVGVTGVGQANTGDGGTNTGAGAKGSIFGANFIANAVNGATNLLEVTAGEVDCALQTGSSAKLKMCWSIVSLATDAVHGASVDAALTIGAQTGSTLFNSGVLLTSANGVFPIATGGTVLGSDSSGTVTFGVDFNNLTCSSFCFRSPGFTVDGSGNIANGTSTTGQASIALTNSNAGAGATAAVNITTNAGILQSLMTSSAGAGFAAIQATGAGGLFLQAKNATGGVEIDTGSTPTAAFKISASQVIQFAAAASFSANGSVATVLGSVGPTGSHTTVQTWLTFLDSGGVTRYVPAF